MVELQKYPGYFITTDGRVYSSKTKKFLCDRNCKGYRKVSVIVNGKRYHPQVHRLVAEAYIPNPEGYDTVDHIDGNKTNNEVNNLQWMTHGDNVAKARASMHMIQTPGGEVIEVYNLRKWCAENNLYYGSFYDHRRKYKTKGYKRLT